jgi:hypothetical protein
LHGEFGDDAERAFGADQQTGQVVAGGGFLGAAAGADDAAVGQHDGHGHDVLAHRAVAHGVGAGGARGGHAAERGIGAGVDGEEQAGALEGFVELLARDAGLDGGVEVFGVDGGDLVQAGNIEADAAAHGQQVAFNGAAGAVGDDGHLVLMAQTDGFGDFSGG